MKKSFNSLALLALTGAAMMSSCSKDTDLYDQNSTLKSYEKNWTDTFGEVAADQDWNLATRGSVTVTTPSATEVKVYIVGDDRYTLVADYNDVLGTQTLEFDMPKGSSKLMVNTPSTSFTTTVGGNVDFSTTKTRGSYVGTQNGIERADADESLDKELTANDVFVYREVLPEGTDNRGKVIQNFNVTSDGQAIVVYPVYWQTRQTNTVGVYYTDDGDSIVRVPVYMIKDTDNSTAKLFRQVDSKIFDKQYYYYPNDYSKDLPEWLKNAVEKIANWNSISEEEKTAVLNAAKIQFGDDATIEMTYWPQANTGGNFQIVVKGKTWTYTYSNNGSTEGNASIESTYTGKVLSKGIKVTIPANRLYGFYITNSSNTFYSDASLNSDGYYDSSDVLQDKKACHAAIYKKNGVTYLTFEDWYDTNGDSDMDLNDVVLRVDGIDPDNSEEVHNKDNENTSSWLIACEDLGSDHDYDFNDVVVKVSHVSGDTKLTLTPMAAGGTLPSVIYFNGTEIGEIHELFGATANDDGLYSPINVNSSSTVSPSSVSAGNPKEITVGVSEDFTLTNSNGEVGMGGFTIVVSSNDEKNSANTTIGPSETGKVPQMFMVPATWAWPGEGVQIENVYPGFSQWSSINNSASWDWYSNTSE